MDRSKIANEAGKGAKPVTPSIAQKAVWIIESRLEDGLDLDDLSEALGVSRYHACRTFAAAFGLPPMEYARRRRMAIAAERLRNGADPILDVAVGSGYGSQASFSRSFESIFGAPPGRFRKNSASDQLRLQEPLVMNTTHVCKPVPFAFVKSDEFTVGGLVKRYTLENNGAIPGQWAEFIPRMGDVMGKKGGRTYGVCFANEPDGSFAYLTGVEIDEKAILPADFERLRISAATYAVFEHRGSAATLRDTVISIWDAGLSAAGLEPVEAPDFELYDPDYNPTDEAGRVEIWIPVSQQSSQ